MRLLQWNVQWCRGMDGVVDPARIARVARELCDPDVCCFQEVAVNFPALKGSSGEDQAALVAAEFAGFEAHFVWGVDVPDGRRGRRRFGNLMLSRLPVGRVLRHSLPWPAHDSVPSMPRAALEAVVEAPWGPVRVMTTHLEYYSDVQRAAQVARLCEIETEARAHAAARPSDRNDSGPFHPLARPASSILTGDLNLKPDDPLAARLRQTWRDAWALANPGRPQPPTFGVHDPAFAGAPYCCDYVFVSEDLAPRIAAVRVIPECEASDHQPVILELDA
jgi:endonuclease/exonuclease/phosphatase family metal-dependent hydrolase